MGYKLRRPTHYNTRKNIQKIILNMIGKWTNRKIYCFATDESAIFISIAQILANCMTRNLELAGGGGGGGHNYKSLLMYEEKGPSMWKSWQLLQLLHPCSHWPTPLYSIAVVFHCIPMLQGWRISASHCWVNAVHFLFLSPTPSGHLQLLGNQLSHSWWVSLTGSNSSQVSCHSLSLTGS